MLITTAPFMQELSKFAMTWERRPTKKTMFPNKPFVFKLCICFFDGCREELLKLRKCKAIRMVKKYRDSQGRSRVAPWLQIRHTRGTP